MSTTTTFLKALNFDHHSRNILYKSINEEDSEDTIIPIDCIQQQQQQPTPTTSTTTTIEPISEVEIQSFKQQYYTQCIERFTQLCTEYYFSSTTSPNNITSELLSLYERTDRYGRLILSCNEQIHPQMDILLLQIGYFQTDTIGVYQLLFGSDLVTLLEDAKNHARRRYHLENQQLRIFEFEQVFSTECMNIQQYQNNANDITYRQVMLKQFVDKYKSEISCHSFLKGLRYLLTTQKNESTHVYAWNLPQTIFSQSGDRNYTVDLIRLLFSLGLYPTPDSTNTIINNTTNRDKLDPSIIIDTHRNATIQFIVDTNLSNHMINQLLFVLPSDKQLQTKGLTDILLCTHMTRNTQEDEYPNRFSTILDYFWLLWSRLFVHGSEQ
jgi:hypothetical protein